MHSKLPQTEPLRNIGPQRANPSRWLLFLMPSISDLLFVALLLGLSCGAMGRLLLRDAGTGWHIRNGQLMLQTHSVTRVDPFSATMSGHPWYAWEWLYDVFIAGVHHWMGLERSCLLHRGNYGGHVRFGISLGHAPRRQLADCAFHAGIVIGSFGGTLSGAASCSQLAVHGDLV